MELFNAHYDNYEINWQHRIRINVLNGQKLNEVVNAACYFANFIKKAGAFI